MFDTSVIVLDGKHLQEFVAHQLKGAIKRPLPRPTWSESMTVIGIPQKVTDEYFIKIVRDYFTASDFLFIMDENSKMAGRANVDGDMIRIELYNYSDRVVPEIALITASTGPVDS
jgi:hypothetical protein